MRSFHSKSTRADSERFCHRRKIHKCGNTLCISLLRGPHKKQRPLWGEEKPGHSRNFPLAGNGALCSVLRRSVRLGQKIRFFAAGDLFRVSLLKRERGERFIHPAVAPVSLIQRCVSHLGAHQADRTLRPFARRRAKTLRPLEEAILWRKP